jgi:hypothetical protein
MNAQFKIVEFTARKPNLLTGKPSAPETFYEIKGPGIDGYIYRDRAEAEADMDLLARGVGLPPEGYADL